MLAVTVRFNGICCKIRSIHGILRRFKAKALALAAVSKKTVRTKRLISSSFVFFLLFKWTTENCVSFSFHRIRFFLLLLSLLPNCHRHLIYRREWRFLVLQNYFFLLDGQCLSIFPDISCFCSGSTNIFCA